MQTFILITTCLVLGVVVVFLALRLKGSRSTPPATPAVAARPESREQSFEILDLMTMGVVLLNHALTPVVANPAARKLLQLPGDSLPARLRSDELISIARRSVAEQAPVDAEMSLWPARTQVSVRAVPIGDRGEVVVYLRDMTEEQRTHQIRRQFVVNASHELKTPVAGLQALAEAVGQAIDDDPETAKNFTKRLIGEAERMSRLIQDLLDLSRLEDPVHFSNERVDLADVAEDEARQLKSVAELGDVELTVDSLRGALVNGDQQQLGLMVRNLIDNAIRYTPTGGRVQVRVAHDAADVTLEVEDTGVGIPLQAQARVFERFFRVDQDRARNSGGTGLGLSIVKHVAELHGGHVALTSELGEGSVFSVRLPVAKNGSA